MLTFSLQTIIIASVDKSSTQTLEGRGRKKLVDTQYLEEVISKSGKKKSYLASKIGCSIQSLRLKMNNKYDFTTTEVDGLCTELGITKLTEKEKIFFKK